MQGLLQSKWLQGGLPKPRAWPPQQATAEVNTSF